jgi:hypothetical protein
MTYANHRWTVFGQAVLAVALSLSTPRAAGTDYAFYEPGNHSVQVSVAVDSNGAMKISRGSTSFTVRSYFSRPDGGMLYLGDPPGGANNEMWKVAVLGGGSQYTVIGSNAWYSLSRTITVYPNRIEVRDAFRNLAGATQGVRFGNEIVASDAVTGLVAGVPADQTGSSLNAPERPFVQVLKAGVSLGMVARDDVYRNQSVSYYAPSDGSYGIKDDSFGLAGGASYTTRWELYPTDSRDPFDFYNAVRAEWGTANARIPGLFAFIYPQRPWRKNGKKLEQMTIAEMEDWLDTTGIQTVCFTVNDDLEDGNIEAFGSRYLVSQASKAYWRPIIQRLRQAKPNLKITPYFHLGADLPNDPEVASSRMMLLGGLQKAFVNSSGITRWYYYPTTTNAFGVRMRRVFDAVLSDFNSNAFYWDEYSYGVKSEYLDGAEWDGSSVVINSNNNTVSKQVTLTALATRNVREQWTKELLERGMTMWTNWQPTTEQDTARNQPHFLEYFGSGDAAARGYLASPIQLNADSNPASNADVLAVVHRFLEAGLLYAHIGSSAYAETSPSILSHFYPMTPKELHPGYVLGRERIVTSITGAFGFGNSGTLDAFIYDRSGRLKDDSGRTVLANGKTYQLVVLAADEVAVIEPEPRTRARQSAHVPPGPGSDR